MTMDLRNQVSLVRSVQKRYGDAMTQCGQTENSFERGAFNRFVRKLLRSLPAPLADFYWPSCRRCGWVTTFTLSDTKPCAQCGSRTSAARHIRLG